ncbi:PPK2 family polyphosphate kinase [Streptomyces sp. NPDC057638]|uniref:polyphosphate kinase 2 family protein n=1 Tax=Streptomyces sp. NPDC057638 TaxID=3346190 RepID=UPI0036CE05E2
MADKRAARIADFIAPLRVAPGSTVDLARDFDPRYKAHLDRAQGEDLLRRGVEMLAEYQPRLAAQDTYGVLVCLQALDAGGKDGTIRHVMSGMNPQGVRVSSFKVPSAEELDHDFLWRYARRLPARGDIAVFNRSHYEEVLVVRVHQEVLDRQRLPPPALRPGIWKRRYREINDWERHLTDNGFQVVKIFLNLSREEQRQRFLSRIDLPEKNWKFSAADVRERRYWDDYQRAFSEMLSATSTRWAPWYVVPADRKWFARICAAAVLVHTLTEIDPRYPTVSAEARGQLQSARRELEREAPGADPKAKDATHTKGTRSAKAANTGKAGKAGKATKAVKTAKESKKSKAAGKTPGKDSPAARNAKTARNTTAASRKGPR